jgi:hypothetical protein
VGKVQLAWAASEVVATALQQKAAIGIEANCGICPIDLFLDHEIPTSDLLKPCAPQIFVTRLQAGVEDVAGSRVFMDSAHRRSTRATAMMWFKT